MDRIIRYGAYGACIIQILVALYILTETYSTRDSVFVLLMILPPLLAIKALYSGPDREERRLTREVHKARLRKELESLKGEKSP